MYIDLADVDPNDYLIVGPLIFCDWVVKLIKSRKVLMEMMKKSGEHDSDTYNFVEAALKKSKHRKVLGDFPFYYFCYEGQFV